MARSKDVYAVLGLLCLDAAYRAEFFAATPGAAKTAAKKLVGSLTRDELAQIMRIAGVVDGADIAGKKEYVRDLKSAFGNLYDALQCPTFPCPDPDPWTT
jgi:hypothetical protein